MLGKIRMVIGLTVAAIAILVTVPIQYVSLKTGLYRMGFGATRFYKVIARVLGFRTVRHGAATPLRPLLLVANHVSWTDIVIVGSMTDGTFIAKGDMAGWPLVGSLAKLQQTIFVDRTRRRSSGAQAAEIAERLVGDDPMILFAEGTTGDGNGLLPFKSTLFGAADLAIRERGAERVYIQPVTVAYTRFHGMPMNRQHRVLAAWIGDSELWSHIKQLLKEGAMDVEVMFGTPVEYTAASSRKAVTRQIEDEVRKMLTPALRDVNGRR